jgi:hypothetical protein
MEAGVMAEIQAELAAWEAHSAAEALAERSMVEAHMAHMAHMAHERSAAQQGACARGRG